MNKPEFNILGKSFAIPLNWLLVLFILLNALFKFYYLPDESIYGDEAYSIFHAQKPLAELTEIFLHDQNPPLHIIVLHFWMQLFGVSDISAKGLSVILNILCAVVLFLFAKKFLNKQAALFVSVLFLFSNVQLFYSHEVRTYALVQLLCISSFYFYFKLLTEPDKKSIAALSVINLLLLFSHYLTIFIFITQFLCVWLFLKKAPRGIKYYLISQLLTALFFVPWLKVLFANLPQSGSFWLTAPGYGELKWFVFMLNGSESLFTVFTTIILSSIIMVLLNRRFRFFYESFDTKVYIVFLCLYILPIGLDYWVAQYTPVFLGRYFLYATLGLFLLIAYIISYLNTSAIIRIMIVMPVFYFLFTAFNAKPEKEDDWKSIMPRIKKIQTGNTVIFISASYKYKDFAFYYDREAFKDYKNTIQRLYQKGVYCSKDGQWGWEHLNLDTVDQVIFVQSHSQFEDPEGKTRQSLFQKYKICSEYNRINITYTVFKKNNLPCFSVRTIAERKKEKCDLWTESIGINETFQDSVIIYSANMEWDSTCGVNTLLTKEKANSGVYSCIIHSQQPYSVGLIKNVKDINGIRNIDISGYVNCKPGSDVRLVVSVEKAGEAFYRKELLVKEKIKTFDIWNEVMLSATIPDDVPKDSELKIYFWNPSETIAFIDDITVRASY